MPSPLETDAKLEEVQINGDSATGFIVQTRNGKQRRDKIAFTKGDGGWKIDIVRSAMR